MSSIARSFGGAAGPRIGFGYDNANRVTSEQNAEGTVTYGYDAANELTGASGSRAETYTYDSGGNRTMTGYTTGSGNELTASPGTTYTYDNEGNLTAQADTSSHVVTSYSYDYRNRLTAVTVGGTVAATYTYDALDRRIGFKDNGTQTWVVWDGQNPYADFNGSGTLQERYLYGPAIDEALTRTDSGGTAWYLTDRMFSIRNIVDSSGSLLDHIAYDSFGGRLSESNPSSGDRFKYTGREFDSTINLYDYRARFCSPGTGRFVRLDPLGFKAGDANLFRYVGNSTPNAIDPLGTFVFPPGLIAGLIYGVASGVTSEALHYMQGDESQTIASAAYNIAVSTAMSGAIGAIPLFGFGSWYMIGGIGRYVPWLLTGGVVKPAVFVVPTAITASIAASEIGWGVGLATLKWLWSSTSTFNPPGGSAPSPNPGYAGGRGCTMAYAKTLNSCSQQGK